MILEAGRLAVYCVRFSPLKVRKGPVSIDIHLATLSRRNKKKIDSPGCSTRAAKYLFASVVLLKVFTGDTPPSSKGSAKWCMHIWDPCSQNRQMRTVRKVDDRVGAGRPITSTPSHFVQVLMVVLVGRDSHQGCDVDGSLASWQCYSDACIRSTG